MSGSTDSGNSWQERLPPEHIHKTFRESYDDHWITTLIPSEYLDDLLFPEKNNNIDYVWSYPVLFAEAFLRYWLFHGNKVAYEKLRWWQWVEKGEKIEGRDFEDLQSGRKFFHKELIPLRKKSGEMPLAKDENRPFKEILIEKIEAFRECHGIIPMILEEKNRPIEGLPLPFQIDDNRSASGVVFEDGEPAQEWTSSWNNVIEQNQGLRIGQTNRVRLFLRTRDWMLGKAAFLKGESFLLPLLLAMRQKENKNDLGEPLKWMATGKILKDRLKKVDGTDYKGRMAAGLQSEFVICAYYNYPDFKKFEENFRIIRPRTCLTSINKFIEEIEKKFPAPHPLNKDFNSKIETLNKEFPVCSYIHELEKAIKLSGKGKSILLKGEAGLGKTVLGGQIAKKLGSDWSIEVIPFYFGRKAGSVDDLERFLMKRMIRRFQNALYDWAIHDSALSLPLEEFLHRLNEKSLLKNERVVLVLDAIDEGICDDENNYQKLEKILCILKKAFSKSFSVIATSRPNQFLERLENIFRWETIDLEPSSAGENSHETHEKHIEELLLERDTEFEYMLALLAVIRAAPPISVDRIVTEIFLAHEKIPETKAKLIYSDCLTAGLCDQRSTKENFTGLAEQITKIVEDKCSRACKKWNDRLTNNFVNQFEDLKGESRLYALRNANHHLNQADCKPQDFYKLGRTESFRKALRNYDESHFINFLEKGWQAYQKLIPKKITERHLGMKHFLLEADEMDEERAYFLAIGLSHEISDCISLFEGNHCVHDGLQAFPKEDSVTLESWSEKLNSLSPDGRPDIVVVLTDPSAESYQVCQKLSCHDWVSVVILDCNRAGTSQEDNRVIEASGLDQDTTVCLDLSCLETADCLSAKEAAESAWFMLKEAKVREGVWGTRKAKIEQRTQSTENKYTKPKLQKLSERLQFAWANRPSQMPMDENKKKAEEAYLEIEEIIDDLRKEDQSLGSFWDDEFLKELRPLKELPKPYAKVDEGTILRKSLQELRAEFVEVRKQNTDYELIHQLPSLLEPFLRCAFFDELLVRYDEITGRSAVDAKGEEENRSVLDRYCHELGHDALPLLDFLVRAGERLTSMQEKETDQKEFFERAYGIWARLGRGDLDSHQQHSLQHPLLHETDWKGVQLPALQKVIPLFAKLGEVEEVLAWVDPPLFKAMKKEEGCWLLLKAWQILVLEENSEANKVLEKYDTLVSSIALEVLLNLDLLWRLPKDSVEEGGRSFLEVTKSKILELPQPINSLICLGDILAEKGMTEELSELAEEPKLEKWENAHLVYKDWVKLLPEPEANYGKGVYGKLIEIARVNALDSENVETILELGDHLAKKGMLEEALPLAEQFLAKSLTLRDYDDREKRGFLGWVEKFLISKAALSDRKWGLKQAKKALVTLIRLSDKESDDSEDYKKDYPDELRNVLHHIEEFEKGVYDSDKDFLEGLPKDKMINPFLLFFLYSHSLKESSGSQNISAQEIYEGTLKFFENSIHAAVKYGVETLIGKADHFKKDFEKPKQTEFSMNPVPKLAKFSGLHYWTDECLIDQLLGPSEPMSLDAVKRVLHRTCCEFLQDPSTHEHFNEVSEVCGEGIWGTAVKIQ